MSEYPPTTRFEYLPNRQFCRFRNSPAKFISTELPNINNGLKWGHWSTSMEEEIFTRDEAAAFLKVDKGTIAQWIKSGRLPATRKNPHKKKSPYLICKSDCIAAVRNPIHNQSVNAVDVQEDKACQSNNEPVRGTVTSLRLVEVELDGLLGLRTKGKHKNSMTN